MIHDVDESLREVVKRRVVNGSNVEISFEAPSKDWAARRNTPTINLYLYDIREDLHRRTVQLREVRDPDGIVTDRRMPYRKFKLSYMITAWTQRPEDEHRLLAALLACFLRSDVLPEEHLQGTLVDLLEPVRSTVALPLPEDRSISDVWTALGGELKPSLDLIVTAPFDPDRHAEVGPPVLEEPRIGLRGPGGEVELAGGAEAAGKGTGRAGKGRGRTGAGPTEAAPAGEPEEGEVAVWTKALASLPGRRPSRAEPAGEAGGEEEGEGANGAETRAAPKDDWEVVQGGGPGQKGRTLKFRPIPPRHR